MSTRKSLGKGLNTLFGETASINLKYSDPSGLVELDINSIDPNNGQPRKSFKEDSLDELAASIKNHGIMQPIIVRQNSNDRYIIVAGERRWRAARIAGLNTIPAIIKELGEKAAVELAIIENIQREDLNSIEEAEAYSNLMNEFNLTQEEVSKTIGKSRPAIANKIRLLSLEPYVQRLVADGLLTGGHARTLLGLQDKTKQSEIAEYIIDNELTVRQVEKLVKDSNSGQKEKSEKKKSTEKVPEIKKMEDSFIELLGTKVQIEQKKDNKGKLVIEYYSLEDFERIKEIIFKQ